MSDYTVKRLREWGESLECEHKGGLGASLLGYAEAWEKQLADRDTVLFEQKKFIDASLSMARFSRSMRNMKFPLQPVENKFIDAFEVYEARRNK